MSVAAWHDAGEPLREPSLGFLIRRRLEMIRQRALSGLAAFGVVFGLTMLLMLALPDVYRSSAVVVVQGPHIPDLYVRPATTMGLQERMTLLTQQITSRSRLIEVIREFNLYPAMMATRPAILVADYMRSHIEIEPASNLTFRVTYEGLDPRTVQQVTAKLAKLYVDLNAQAAAEENQAMSAFLDREVEKMSHQLADRWKAVAAFNTRHADELPDQAPAIAMAIDQLEHDRTTQEDGLMAARQGLQAMQREPRRGPIEKLKAELAHLRELYTDRHPDVRRLKEQIQRAEAAPALGNANDTDAYVGPERLALEQEVSRRVADLQRIDELLIAYRERRSHIPVVAQQYNELNQGLKVLQDRYDALVARRFEARLSSNLGSLNQGEHLEILDPAPLPQAPFRPNRLRILVIGAALSIMCGLGFPLLMAELDPSFRSGQELKSEVALPILGEVPHVGSQSARLRQVRNLARTALVSAAVLVGAAIALRWYLTRVF